MKHTPLFETQSALGGRMVDFSGWEMPVQFAGTVAEHMAVREACGLFDASHMGEFWFEGPDAASCLQQLTANDINTLVDGKAQYSFLLNEDGGIVDDIIVYRFGPERFMMVVNAGNLDNDWHWILAHRTGECEIRNASADTALIAVQGPYADKLLDTVADTAITPLKRFHFLETTIAGVAVTIARTGYTGSPGCEIFTPSTDAATVWDTLMASGAPFGVQPCGLGARDTLRLEMAYPLHGHEITAKHTPWEAGLGWVVKTDTDFIGKVALVNQKNDGIERKLVGFIMQERGVPRDGYSIIHEGKPVGYVTSGTMSPCNKVGIGLGYLPINLATPDTKVHIDIRGHERAAIISKTPFVTPKGAA